MDLDTMAYRALVFLVPSNQAEVGRPARPVLDDCPTGERSWWRAPPERPDTALHAVPA